MSFKNKFTKSLLSLSLLTSLIVPTLAYGQESINVAVENNSQPLSFTDQSGELTGYEIDVLKAIDEKLVDYEFKIEAVSSEATQVGLDSGKYNLIGGGLFKTKEREEMYDFPQNHTGASIIRIYKRADDNSIQTLADLKNKKIHPVTPNGGIYNLLVAYNEENPDQQLDIQLGEAGSFAQRYQALNDGVSDAVIQPSNLGQDEIIEKLDLNVAPVDEPVRVNGTYFVFAKGQEDFIKAFDQAVSELKEDGTLEELSKKWYQENIFDYELTK